MSGPPPAAPGPGAAPARGRWKMRDRPAALWLVLLAVLVVVHPYVPGSRWLMVHLLFLGAATHSIMVWSAHFSIALLKATRTGLSQAAQTRRLVTLHCGIALVVVGVPTGWWWLTLLGGTAICVAVAWHGAVLLGALRVALPARFGVSVRFYVAAAAFLPVGVTFGVILARGLGADWHGRVLVAHTMTNLLGWIGLSVAGTLITLWPTMLRTQIDDAAAPVARTTFPALVAAVAVIDTGALLGLRWVGVAGLAAYGLGWLRLGRPLLRTARRRAPMAFSTWSMGAAVLWLPVGLATLAVTLARTGGWGELEDHYGRVTAVFAVGFVVQALFGALAYLLPSVLGGGPSVVRAGAAHIERLGLARVVTVNLGLVLCLLPVPNAVRVALSALVFVALAAFLPLAMKGIIASIRARRALVGQGPRVVTPEERAATKAATAAERTLPLAQLLGAVLAVTVAVTVGVAVDPSAAGIHPAGVSSAPSGTSAAGSVAPTGHTTTVRIEARDMRFIPDTVTVPAGDRLEIEVVNTDPSKVHDLVLANGASSGRLLPGRSATVDVGVVGHSLDGWCSMVGHRMMGMTMTVTVTGGAAAAPHPAAPSPSGGHTMPGMGPAATGGVRNGAPIDLTRSPEPGFRAQDPVLPPVPAGRVHQVTLTVTEEMVDVAPGVKAKRWTYNGTVPGPTLHGRVGDTFDVTVVNKATSEHSIDFHAGTLAPDEVMRDIPPGGTLHYRFTATRSGIWLYHCSTMPMTAHIAAGMHGAVIIDPPDLAPVARSYVLTQSEIYAATDGSPVDAVAARTGLPSAVTFNGTAFQYDHVPLTAKVGERIRIWVLDAGPNRATSFHVVGGQFDTVYAEGAYLLKDGRGALGGSTGGGNGGAQALALQPGQGGFVELTLPEAGHYPFVTHVMADAERGAHGIIAVTP